MSYEVGEEISAFDQSLMQLTSICYYLGSAIFDKVYFDDTLMQPRRKGIRARVDSLELPAFGALTPDENNTVVVTSLESPLLFAGNMWANAGDVLP